jgi:hypothetical protein
MHRLERIAIPRCGWERLLFGWRLACGALLCLALLPAFSDAAGQAPADAGTVASEERVKAASLYRFLSYVEWPPALFDTATSPYVVGVAGADDIADELSRISAGRSVNGRTVAVRKIQAGNAPAGLHVLFVGRAERPRPWLRQFQRQPVLLVTESEGALAQGSMINFRIVEDRVRFEVSLDPVEKSGLKISSRMLAVAISVTKEPPQ